MARQGFIHDKLDIKFLILYIMTRVAAPIDLATLTDLCFCDVGVDYFDFSEAVPELVETGHLTLEDGQYNITDKGRENSAACESSLSYSIKQRCDDNLTRVNARLLRLAQVYTQVTPREDGGFTVTLRLSDESGTLLTLTLFSPTEEQARHLTAGFQEKPEQIYNGLLQSLLNGEEKHT